MPSVQISTLVFDVQETGAGYFLKIGLATVGGGAHASISVEDLRRLRNFLSRQLAHDRPRPSQDLVDEIIGHGVRSMARVHHPDTSTGDTKKMTEINTCVNWIKEKVQE